jgi:hypothetical protein
MSAACACAGSIIALALLAAPAPAATPTGWLTPAEAAAFERTPTLAETLAFIRRVAAAKPSLVRVESFGTSAEGRSLPLVVVSGRGAFTPAAAARAGLPVVMVQAGIHAGEIDGKDACLAILRDLAIGPRPAWLDQIVLLLVPVYNVDGHERVSPFNRANQDGPKAGMGQRTTTAGLDLNRDHLKAAAAETRALLSLVNRWRPHLHVDVHVTDGSDHDWVLTYTWAEAPQLAPSLDAWLTATMPGVIAATRNDGVRCGPYVELVDSSDPTKGFSSFVGGGRYSTGYFPLRNRPSVLIETHAYKPFGERVEATRLFLGRLLEAAGRGGAALVTAVAEAERRTVALGRADAPPSEVVLEWEEAKESDRAILPIYRWSVAPSRVTGRPLLRYERGVVNAIEVPHFHRARAARTAARPRGYLIVPGWPRLAEAIAAHGLVVEPLASPARLAVETLRVARPEYAARPYQGLTGVTAAVARQIEERTVPAGTLWIPADQADFEVAAQLLEPDCPESLLAWGELSTVFEGREYIDGRSLAALAAKLLEDPAVRAEWQRALEDEKFAADSRARTQWWYRRTEYYRVQEVGLLPVLRLLQPAPLPLAAAAKNRTQLLE